MDKVELAQTFAKQGRIGDAIELLKSAGAAGDSPCLAELAVWYLRGDIVPRDLVAARSYLRHAVEIGHVDAALMEIALTANGSGSVPDWTGALRLLRKAASGDPLAAQHIALIGAMTLDDAGAPRHLPPAERLSDSPHVVRFRNFLTPEECGHIALTAHPTLEPAMVVDPKTGKMVAHPIRTSSGSVIGPTIETLPIRAINHRIAAISGTHIAQGESLSVLHYAPGQEYRPHMDVIIGAANPRIKTVIMYLNDGYQGGATQFTATGLRVEGRAGDALLFDNILPDGRPDSRSRHAGLPIEQGVKWIATRWIRQNPFDPWSDKLTT